MARPHFRPRLILWHPLPHSPLPCAPLRSFSPLSSSYCSKFVRRFFRRCSSPRSRLSRLSGRPQRASTAPHSSDADQNGAAASSSVSPGRRMLADDCATRYALASSFDFQTSCDVVYRFLSSFRFQISYTVQPPIFFSFAYLLYCIRSPILFHASCIRYLVLFSFRSLLTLVEPHALFGDALFGDKSTPIPRNLSPKTALRFEMGQEL